MGVGRPELFASPWPRRPLVAGVALFLVLALAGCGPEKKTEAPAPRPVRTVTVQLQGQGDTVTLTGHIEAVDEAAMAFRIGGRMTDRLVNVGDIVKPGQELARLDPQNEVNAFRSAEAGVNAAQAQLVQARAAFERQRTLLAQGHTPRAQFDIAEKTLATAQAGVDNAEVQERIAADRVSYTVLQADAAGTVTARGAEPGEVVQAGQMVVRMARQGGRDAVFDVPATVMRSSPSDLEVQVRLTDDASVSTLGRVREVSPQADPVTRTFRVRVGLTNPPAAMLLGSTVTGQVHLAADDAIVLPASALTEYNHQPAVWVVDPAKLTVSLRSIEVQRFDPATVTVAHGLGPGDVVVTAGVQALHPDQSVRLLGPA
jgi:RND family efflux transporter MFP subunit